jgi:hypothetical protein
LEAKYEIKTKEKHKKMDQIGLTCRLGLKEFDHKIEDAQNMFSKNTHHIGHLVRLNLFATLDSLRLIKCSPFHFKKFITLSQQKQMPPLDFHPNGSISY